MTKRVITFTTILALLLTFLIEICTEDYTNCNLLIRLISSCVYFYIIIFGLIEGYYGIKDLKNNIYNQYLCEKHIFMLISAIFIFQIIGNLTNISIVTIIIYSFFAIVFGVVAYLLAKEADRYCDFYFEDDD